MSPRRATLESLVVPGLGQAHAGAYVRASIAFGIESYFVTRALIEESRARDAEDLAAGAPEGEREALENSADLHRSERDDFLFWMGIAHLYNLLDAYVAAHLSRVEDEVDRVERITFRAGPAPEGGGEAALSWTF